MTTLSALILSIATVNAQPQGVVLDFYSNNCPPCRQMDPVVSRLQRQGYAIRKVNVNEHPDLANRFQIHSIPQFVLVVRGREIKRLAGVQSEAALRRLCMQIPTEPAPESNPPQPVARAQSDRTSSVPVQPAVAGREPEKKSRFPLPFFNRGQNDSTERELESQDLVVRAKHDGIDLPDSLPADIPMASSTRIRVKDSGSINYGSGTIIDSPPGPGRTLILTCGHVLRNLSKSAQIEVDLFIGDRYETFLGKAVAADFQADVGLIAIATSQALPASRVAGTDSRLHRGEQVFSIGCGGGDEPTRQQHQVTVLNRYLGPANVECTGVPVQGRSGGGLFNAQGQVVGVCMAADPKDKRGLYAGLAAIHNLLDEARLSHLYAPAEPARTTQLEQPAIADARELPEPSFGEAMDDPAAFQLNSEEFNPFAEEDALAHERTVAEQGAFAEQDRFAEEQVLSEESGDLEMAEVIEGPIGTPDHSIEEIEQALAQAGEAEVVCIVRPLNNPRAASRVVIINRASPKFVAYLTGELEDQIRPTSARVATADSRNSRPGLPGGHTIRAFHRRDPNQPAAGDRRFSAPDLPAGSVKSAESVAQGYRQTSARQFRELHRAAARAASDRDFPSGNQFRFEPVVTSQPAAPTNAPQPYRRSEASRGPASR